MFSQNELIVRPPPRKTPLVFLVPCSCSSSALPAPFARSMQYCVHVGVPVCELTSLCCMQVSTFLVNSDSLTRPRMKTRRLCWAHFLLGLWETDLLPTTSLGASWKPERFSEASDRVVWSPRGPGDDKQMVWSLQSGELKES